MKNFKKSIVLLLVAAILAPASVFAQEMTKSEEKIAALIREKQEAVDGQIIKVVLMKRQIAELQKERAKSMKAGKSAFYTVLGLGASSVLGMGWMMFEQERRNSSPRRLTVSKIFFVSQTLLFIGMSVYAGEKYGSKIKKFDEKLNELSVLLEDYEKGLHEDQANLNELKEKLAL